MAYLDGATNIFIYVFHLRACELLGSQFVD